MATGEIIWRNVAQLAYEDFQRSLANGADGKDVPAWHHLSFREQTAWMVASQTAHRIVVQAVLV